MPAQDEPMPATRLKPLRGFQLFLSMFLFHLAIFMNSYAGFYTSVILGDVLLASAFIYMVFITVAILTLREGLVVHITPMFMCRLMGIPLFIINALMCYFSPATNTEYLVIKVTVLFSCVLSGSFILEALIMIQEPTSTSILKPLKGLQLGLTMFIFHLGGCLISIPTTHMSVNYCIIVMVTGLSYAWMTGGWVMSQRNFDPVRINAVFMFALLGIPLFIVVGLMCYGAPGTDTSYWVVKAILLFCFLAAAAFLIEILLVLPISRKNKRILAEQSLPKKESITVEQVAPPPPPPPAEPTKRDLTTSVSSLRLPPDADETATPDHSYRKVSFGRRREYVDTPTSVPSMAAVKIAEIQTEPKPVSVEGSQTCKCELKEVLVQTVSRCEFCNQQMQAGASALNQQSAMCGPPCPTVVQLLHSGIALPCCTSGSCVAGVLKIEQQKQQPQQLEYQKQEQPQPQPLQYQKPDKPQMQQVQDQKQDKPQPQQQVQRQKQEKPQPQQQLQNQKQEQPKPQQLQFQKQEQSQPQQPKITQKTQHVQLEEPRMYRVLSKESNRGDSSQTLTSFTKVTVTAFCATPNATTMEVATSRGSKENVVTTYVPPQATVSTETTVRPQIVTTSQQTEKAASFLYSKFHRVMGAQGREFETSKEEAIFASECYDMEKTTIDDTDYLKPPQPAIALKSDDDDSKSDVKKNDSKESRQFQTTKTSKDKGRRGREPTTPTRPVKRTKRTAGPPSQKEKKEDARTYSRFLPLEDVKPRDARCIEQEYDLSNICIPIHTHEVIEFQPCGSSRTIPSVFQRNNRIDPVCVPECENYAIQTGDPHYQCMENPHFQCEIDTPAATCITPLVTTTATTDTDICKTCRKEQVQSPQADIFQYYNVYKDKEGWVYCDICAPPNSDKVPIITDRSEDILQECSICGNFPCIIDARSVGVSYKHEERSSYCMKCGQLQF